MDYETAKVHIRESKTVSGVYGALERAGIDTGTYSLSERRKMAVRAYHYKEAEVIQCAQMRLIQIENHEV